MSLKINRVSNFNIWSTLAVYILDSKHNLATTKVREVPKVLTKVSRLMCVKPLFNPIV